MIYKLVVPVVVALLSLTLSNGAPQTSFQFIKKDGKVLNAIGDLPSTIDSTRKSEPSKGLITNYAQKLGNLYIPPTAPYFP